MSFCFPITTCARRAVYVGETFGKQMSRILCTVSQSPTSCCSFLHSNQFCGLHSSGASYRTISSSFNGSQFDGKCVLYSFLKSRRNRPTLISSSVDRTKYQLECFGLVPRAQNMRLRVVVPNHEGHAKVSWRVKPAKWRQGSTSAGLFFGVCVCFASSDPVSAELSKRPRTMDDDDDECDSSAPSSSHGKSISTDYSITGIPGDGRCLFRSVVHGACIRSGKPTPNENLQKELADELRSKVADEFVKRREETEWFVEGDFDMYVSRIRQPHVWGGEPELLMASHVLKMPITVYMHDDDSGGLIAIAEYGQEYGKENPIRVLYHGYGHYDALRIPVSKGAKSRL